MDEDARQDFDDLAWDRNDEAVDLSRKKLRRIATCLSVEAFVRQKLEKHAKLEFPIILGGYNVVYRFSFRDASPDVVIRRPCPGLAQFPGEKTVREAATAAFLCQNTGLPVPQPLHYGLSTPEPDHGPYIILQYVENEGTLSDRLKAPNDDPDEAHLLDPDFPEPKLEELCTKVACCLLQLSQPSFPCIGSLGHREGIKDSFFVAGRPLSQNMNNMIRLSNIPRAILPPEDKTYKTADEWYVALAEMHIAQLIFQHNDLVTSENDCRNKYVARQIFYKLAKEGRLSTFGFKEDDWSFQSKTQPSTTAPAPRPGSIRLWGDDLRPGNILLDGSDDIVAIIDWEFTYAGPTQFILDPPWWLLLEVPESWPDGIDNWEEVYAMRLKTWLSAMEKGEQNTTPGSLPFSLSTYMRESWESGRFWLNYAARKSWAFDTIFWKYLDKRFFGDREDVPKHELWKTRMHLLGKEARSAMEPFVERKMAESQERVLVDWDPDEARMLYFTHAAARATKLGVANKKDPVKNTLIKDIKLDGYFVRVILIVIIYGSDRLRNGKKDSPPVNKSRRGIQDGITWMSGSHPVTMFP
ncbi:hypothetical protein HJFPF1_05142 [Paramyrothecium foliicola]|nr:hypothetical protein HJFPF1_05142 [Paramyrothecium foliicola]